MADGGKWVLGVGLVLGSSLLSNESRAAVDERTDVLSLTFSPIHLLFPAIELQGEYKVIDHLGVSLIAGYGWPTTPGTDQNGASIDIHFELWELGTQVVWYPLRKFRSLELGAEAMYIHISTKDVGLYDASGVGAGVSVGPFVGFKFIAGPGFTLFAQLGVSYLAAHAEASDNTGAQASKDQKNFLPNLNFNLGWSF